MSSTFARLHQLKSIPRRNRLIFLFGALLIVAAVFAVVALTRSDDKKETSSQPLASAAVDSYRKQLPQLKKESEKHPKDVVAQREYAVALYAVSKVSEAKTQYEKAIALSPKDATLQNNLGNVYRDLKNYDKAISAYQRSIQLNPRQTNAYINLANLQIYILHKADDGVATYKKAIENLPGNNEMQILLGLAYEQKGDTDKAKATYQTVLASDPNNNAAKSNLARLTD